MNKINMRKEELAYLDEEFNNKKRTSEINLDLDMKKYGRDKALQILKENGESTVSEIDYKRLNNDYQELLSKQKEEIKTAVDNEHQRNTKHASS